MSHTITDLQLLEDSDSKHNQTPVTTSLPVIYQPPPLPEVKLDLDMVRKFYAPKEATDQEIEAFIQIAQICHLEPAKREIYLTKYGSTKAAIIVGYQIYVDRANRTNLLDGWTCEVDDKDNPTEAVLTIWRKDWARPFTWTTLRSEVAYVYSSRSRTMVLRATHKTQPCMMLKKCAIAQGFRLCFPSECFGLPYIPEELPSTQHITSEEIAPFAWDRPLPGEDRGLEPDPPDYLGPKALPEGHAPPQTYGPQDVLSQLPDPGPFNYWRARYFAYYSPDRKTGQCKFPLVFAYFKNEANRQKWQNATTGKASITNWTEQDFRLAISELPALEAALALPSTPTGQPSEQPESPPESEPASQPEEAPEAVAQPEESDQEAPHYSDDPALLAAAKPFEDAGIPTRQLFFYLRLRFISPTTGEAFSEIVDFLNTCALKPVLKNKLAQAVNKSWLWAAQEIGGVDKVLNLIQNLHAATTSIDDPEVGAALLSRFFISMQVDARQDSLFLISDIPTALFDSWPQKLDGAAQELGIQIPHPDDQPDPFEDEPPPDGPEPFADQPWHEDDIPF